MNDNTIITEPERTYRNHLDMACEQFADELIATQAELREALARVADLETDLRIMAEIAREAIQSLHAAHLRNERHREAFQRVLDELPPRREQAIQKRLAA